MAHAKSLIFTPAECLRYHAAYHDSTGEYGRMIVPFSTIPDYSNNAPELYAALGEARDFVEMAIRAATAAELDDSVIVHRQAILARIDVILAKVKNQQD